MARPPSPLPPYLVFDECKGQTAVICGFVIIRGVFIFLSLIFLSSSALVAAQGRAKIFPVEEPHLWGHRFGPIAVPAVGRSRRGLIIHANSAVTVEKVVDLFEQTRKIWSDIG